MTARVLNINFSSSKCTILDKEGSVVAVANKERNLYRLVLASPPCATAKVVKVRENKLNLWHQRLGHLNVGGIKHLASKALVKGLEIGENEKMELCKGCIQGKHHRLPFPAENEKRATEPLELIHTDLCGPMQQASIGGAKYFLTFIDDATRKTFVYFLKAKHEVFGKFQEFKALAERQTSKQIKAIRSDNGGEFVSKAFDEHLKSHGIHHQKTVPYTPQQNGVAERANRTIVERARTMLYARDLDRELWAEAVATAVYISQQSQPYESPGQQDSRRSLDWIQTIGRLPQNIRMQSLCSYSQRKTQQTRFKGCGMHLHWLLHR